MYLDEISSENGQGEYMDLSADLCTASLYAISFRTNPFRSGVLVRNDDTKARLKEKFPNLGENGIIMSVLMFLPRPFT
jgi:hypothetical protein